MQPDRLELTDTCRSACGRSTPSQPRRTVSSRAPGQGLETIVFPGSSLTAAGWVTCQSDSEHAPAPSGGRADHPDQLPALAPPPIPPHMGARRACAEIRSARKKRNKERQGRAGVKIKVGSHLEPPGST